jgi:hypothetical protein
METAGNTVSEIVPQRTVTNELARKVALVTGASKGIGAGGVDVGHAAECRQMGGSRRRRVAVTGVGTRRQWCMKGIGRLRVGDTVAFTEMAGR